MRRAMSAERRHDCSLENMDHESACRMIRSRVIEFCRLWRHFRIAKEERKAETIMTPFIIQAAMAARLNEKPSDK